MVGVLIGHGQLRRAAKGYSVCRPTSDTLLEVLGMGSRSAERDRERSISCGLSVGRQR
jgi:hypothetical protein